MLGNYVARSRPAADRQELVPRVGRRDLPVLNTIADEQPGHRRRRRCRPRLPHGLLADGRPAHPVRGRRDRRGDPAADRDWPTSSASSRSTTTDPTKIAAFPGEAHRRQGLPDAPDEVFASMATTSSMPTCSSTRSPAITPRGQQARHGRRHRPQLRQPGRGLRHDFKNNDVARLDRSRPRLLARRGDARLYYDAHMDLVSIHPVFNLCNYEWPIYTHYGFYPPAKFVHGHHGRFGEALNSAVSRCRHLRRPRHRIGHRPGRARIRCYTEVNDSVILDGVTIGRGCQVRKTIIDKGAVLPEGTMIGFDKEHDEARGFTVTESGPSSASDQGRALSITAYGRAGHARPDPAASVSGRSTQRRPRDAGTCTPGPARSTRLTEWPDRLPPAPDPLLIIGGAEGTGRAGILKRFVRLRRRAEGADRHHSDGVVVPGRGGLGIRRSVHAHRNRRVDGGQPGSGPRAGDPPAVETSRCGDQDLHVGWIAAATESDLRGNASGRGRSTGPTDAGAVIGGMSAGASIMSGVHDRARGRVRHHASARGRDESGAADSSEGVVTDQHFASAPASRPADVGDAMSPSLVGDQDPMRNTALEVVDVRARCMAAAGSISSTAAQRSPTRPDARTGAPLFGLQRRRAQPCWRCVRPGGTRCSRVDFAERHPDLDINKTVAPSHPGSQSARDRGRPRPQITESTMSQDRPTLSVGQPPPICGIPRSAPIAAANIWSQGPAIHLICRSRCAGGLSGRTCCRISPTGSWRCCPASPPTPVHAATRAVSASACARAHPGGHVTGARRPPNCSSKTPMHLRRGKTRMVRRAAAVPQRRLWYDEGVGLSGGPISAVRLINHLIEPRGGLRFRRGTRRLPVPC